VSSPNDRAPEKAARVHPLVGEVDRSVRSHRILEAAELVRSCPSWGYPDLGTLFAQWEAEGRGALVLLLQGCREHPSVIATVQRHRRAGTVAGIVGGLGAALFIGLLGVLVGLAVMLVVRELAAAWWRPADPAEAATTRALFDVVTYQAPVVRTNYAGAVAFVAVGMATTGFALHSALTLGSSPATLAANAVGFLLIAAGVLTGRALRRLRRSGLAATAGHPPPLTPDGQAQPAERPLDETVVFRRPRLVRSLIVPLFLILAGVLFLTGSTAPVAGVVLIAAAAAIIARVPRTLSEVSPGGVVDRSVTRTRRWSWDEVHRLTTPDNPDDLAIVFVDRRGRHRLLVEGSAISWDRATLERFAEAATGLAEAPDPGPDPVDIRLRSAGLVALAFTITALTLLAAVVVAGPANAGLAPDGVPTFAGVIAVLDGLAVAGIVLVGHGRRRLVLARAGTPQHP
jgi:hypothetical protein